MSIKPLDKKVVVQTPQKVDVKSPAQKQEELVAQKVMSDSLNSEKSKRDVQIRTTDELETRIRNLRKEVESTVIDYNLKQRINENLGASIQAAHIDLANLKSRFTEQNAKLVSYYEKKSAEVQEADKTLQSLIKDNREMGQSLKRERSAFDAERNSNRQLLHDMQKALDQNNAQWKVREADILAREEALKIEKDEFEKYQASLQPEIAHITSIKNENTLLIQRLEQETRNANNMRLAAVSERAQAEESRVLSQEKANQERMRVTNEEARLRKWEQDIKDQELELRAMKSEYDRVLRREKLQADLEQSKS